MKSILVVTKGMPRIRITAVSDADEIIPPQYYIKFFPWDTDSKGNRWGGFTLTRELYDVELAERNDLRPEFDTFEKLLSYFDENPEFYFADPLNTGKMFQTLGQYSQRLIELKEQYERVLNKVPEKLTCQHEGCNMSVGLDENALCRHHRADSGVNQTK